MSSLRTSILAVGLVFVIFELLIGVSAIGMMLSLCGIAVLYWVARQSKHHPRS